MTSQLAPADQAVVAVYLLAMLLVGLGLGRGEKTSEGWFLAGRGLTLPAFVATLVATWYGGILAVGEFGWLSGISVLTVYAVPYYVSAAVFALWLAPKIRRSELFTIPDKLAEVHGRSAGLVGALFVWLLSNPAPYLLMLGVLLELSFGLPAIPALLAGLVLSTVYVYTGGFRADVRVNLVQFVLMFAGFAVLLPFCRARLGGLDRFVAELPELHLSWHGGNPWQYLLAWFFIALWALVEPSFHQRCYAARDPETARRGVLWSILFWMLFDAMTCTAALYSRLALPALENPVMAFPALAGVVLPAGLLGLFYVAMLATVMSTVVSYTFQSGVTFARDLVWRLRGGDPDAQVAGRTAMGLLLTSLIAVTLALLVPSVKDLWYNFGTTFVPGLLLPVLTAYAPRWAPPRRLVPWAMLAASGSSLAWLLIGLRHAQDGWPVYPLGLEPMYPGLLVSLALFVIGRAARLDRNRPPA